MRSRIHLFEILNHYSSYYFRSRYAAAPQRSTVTSALNSKHG